MVGILMGDENVMDALRRDAEPAHLLLQPVVVIARVEHQRGFSLTVEKDIRHPFAHAGDVLVDPTGVERLEDFFSPVHPAHFLFLELGRLL